MQARLVSLITGSLIALIASPVLAPAATRAPVSCIHGKTQIVDSFSDYTLQIVDSFPGVPAESRATSP